MKSFLYATVSLEGIPAMMFMIHLTQAKLSWHQDH